MSMNPYGLHEVYPGAERKEFMAGEGFVTYTAITADFLAGSNPSNVQEINDAEKELATKSISEENGVFTSNAYLQAVLIGLSRSVPCSSGTGQRPSTAEYAEAYGIDDDERSELSKHTYDLGVDDFDFPWMFTGLLASDWMQTQLRAGEIEPDQAANLTLTDWANLIESPGFRDINHTLARTGFGAYGRVGQFHGDIQFDTIKKKLRTELYFISSNVPNVEKIHEKSELTDLFQLDHEGCKDSSGYKPIKLSPVFKDLFKLLRNNKKNAVDADDERENSTSKQIENGSIGCPVARHAVAVRPEILDHPRAKKLIESGMVEAVIDPEGKKTILRQEHSAIDRVLFHVAAQLRAYEEKFGNSLA